MFHYDRNLILAAYRATHPDNLEVEEETIEDFDADLFAEYDTTLRAKANEAGIPVNLFNLSMLLFFATQSGAKLVATRVRHAVRFFNSVQPQP